METYQPIYDAVRSRLCNADIGAAIETAMREANVGHYAMQAAESIGAHEIESLSCDRDDWPGIAGPDARDSPRLETALALALCSAFFLFLTACGRSSFDASNELRRKYPNAELREIPRMGGVVGFMVRTERGAVLSVTFADDGEMLQPREIFPPK